MKKSLAFPGRPVWIAVAVSLTVLLLPAATAASTSSGCSQQDSTFCISAGLTATSNPPGRIAAAPVSLDFSVSNTSTSTAQAYWLHSAALTLASNGIASPPTLTASAQLPNGLLLAGGGTCSSPAYTDCPGGHGSIVAIATLFGNSTPASGTFGIAKIVNRNPPSPGDYGDYDVTLNVTLCVPPYPCFDTSTVSEATIAQPSGGAPPAVAFQITTDGTAPFANGTVSYALNSFSFHVDGQSSQLAGGPAGQTYTILALPVDCGTASGSSSFASHNSVTVAIPESVTVTGCPTAVLPPPVVSGTSASFDGSGSSTPVAGRTITHWDWTFGDGTTAVTTVPTVKHTYVPGSTYAASLVVRDSAGARSSSAEVSAPIPVECLVPKVTGKPLARAKRALAKAHCSVGKVTHAYSRVKSGVVLAQKPTPGKRLPKGAKVGLVVSKGKRS